MTLNVREFERVPGLSVEDWALKHRWVAHPPPPSWKKS
jgi:hypothetical protein